MSSNEDTSLIDNFINQCLDDFIDGECDHNYGEEIAIGGLRTMVRYDDSTRSSIFIQSSKSFFSLVVSQDGGYYCHCICLASKEKPIQSSGPIEKFRDYIESIMTIHLLEAF